MRKIVTFTSNLVYLCSIILLSMIRFFTPSGAAPFLILTRVIYDRDRHFENSGTTLDTPLHRT